jgi:hypothetical protein
MEMIPADKKVGMESWLLTSPFTAIANAEAVTLVKSFFASPRYSAYVGDQARDEYGLNSPSGYIYLEQTDGKSVKILVGNRMESGRYYCTEEGRDGIFELASGFDSLFEIETSNIFPSSVFPVSAEQTADVTIDIGTASYQLVENSGQSFSLNGKVLSDDAAQTLYGYLSQLQFGGVADNADISGEPDVTITLKSGANKLVFGFYGYRNDYFAVELNGSGTASGYIKAEHLAVLVSAFSEAAKS